jgi:hypothetical protein
VFKAFFGALGLLIALAIVSSLAKSQLGAIGQIGEITTRVLSPSASNGTTPAGHTSDAVRPRDMAAAAGSAAPTLPEQVQGVQKSAFEGAREALDRGDERYKRAESGTAR